MMKKYSRYSIDQLIDLVIQNKDTNAFGAIYDIYIDTVYNKVLSMVQSKEIAEDLTHDIFIKIYLNLKKFQHKSKFSTWIYAITYNYCHDYFRKKNKYPVVNFDTISEKINETTYAEEDFIDNIEQIKIEQLKVCLNQIASEEKILLLMKYQDNISIRDIMKILSLKESAVKMRLKRAREAIINICNKKFNN